MNPKYSVIKGLHCIVIRVSFLFCLFTRLKKMSLKVLMKMSLRDLTEMVELLGRVNPRISLI